VVAERLGKHFSGFCPHASCSVCLTSGDQEGPLIFLNMAEMKPLSVSYDRCHELLEICEPSPLRLEEESGLKWKVSRGGQAAGSWAGCVWESKQCGKIRKVWIVGIGGKLYYASRIIYFMTNGIDPYPMEVDHEDRNSLNNNVDNLRLGDDVLQCQNRGTRSDNKSGVKGVSWRKDTSKWRAYIQVDNKQKYLGYYATLKEAAEARNAAVREYFPEGVWSANLIDTELL